MFRTLANNGRRRSRIVHLWTTYGVYAVPILRTNLRSLQKNVFYKNYKSLNRRKSFKNGIFGSRPFTLHYSVVGVVEIDWKTRPENTRGSLSVYVAFSETWNPMSARPKTKGWVQYLTNASFGVAGHWSVYTRKHSVQDFGESLPLRSRPNAKRFRTVSLSI